MNTSHVQRSIAAISATALLSGLLIATITPGADAAPDRVERISETTGLSPARVRDFLADDTTRVADNGMLYVVDEGVDRATARAAAVERAAGDPVGDLAPLEDTFTLHSRPGASRTIYLDFDPTEVRNTLWNSQSGLPGGTYSGWDTDSAPTTFSIGERTGIQKVWAIVAEDYAPFDVDVTTQDPGADRLNRSSVGDPQYGMRVQFSSGASASGPLCQGNCGGVAWVGVFDNQPNSTSYHPAWVFPSSLGNSPKFMADAASHEAGHTLGLGHDATSKQGYYAGHGGWGPIMGAPYDQPITQWNNGTYPDATNLQDDLAVISANGLPVRVDEAGGTIPTSAAVLPASATITGRADVDVFRLGSCTGTVTLSAAVDPTLPNLDVRLELLSASGAVLATADPPSTTKGVGMSADLTHPVSPGVHYARIDGVGRGTTTTGYDDYGSLGTYALKATGCSPTPVATVPTSPRSLTTTVTGSTIRADWLAPETDGGSPVVDYQVQLTNTASSVSTGWDVTPRMLTISDQVPGTYALSVTARNTVGVSASVTTSVTVLPSSPTPTPTPTLTSTPTPTPSPTPTPTVSPTPTPAATPSPAPPVSRIATPRIRRSKRGTPGGPLTVTARWRPVTGATGYRVRALCVDECVKGRGQGRSSMVLVSGTAREMSLPLLPGKWTFKVRAISTESKSRWSTLPKAIRSR